jgi:hypothetical protein
MYCVVDHVSKASKSTGKKYQKDGNGNSYDNQHMEVAAAAAVAAAVEAVLASSLYVLLIAGGRVYGKSRLST